MGTGWVSGGTSGWRAGGEGRILTEEKTRQQQDGPNNCVGVPLTSAFSMFLKPISCVITAWSSPPAILHMVGPFTASQLSLWPCCDDADAMLQDPNAASTQAGIFRSILANVRTTPKSMMMGVPRAVLNKRYLRGPSGRTTIQGGHTTMASGHTTMMGGHANMMGGRTTMTSGCTTIVGGHTTMKLGTSPAAPASWGLDLNGPFLLMFLNLFEVLPFCFSFSLTVALH